MQRKHDSKFKFVSPFFSPSAFLSPSLSSHLISRHLFSRRGSGSIFFFLSPLVKRRVSSLLRNYYVSSDRNVNEHRFFFLFNWKERTISRFLFLLLFKLQIQISRDLIETLLLFVLRVGDSSVNIFFSIVISSNGRSQC